MSTVAYVVHSRIQTGMRGWVSHTRRGILGAQDGLGSGQGRISQGPNEKFPMASLREPGTLPKQGHFFPWLCWGQGGGTIQGCLGNASSSCAHGFRECCSWTELRSTPESNTEDRVLGASSDLISEAGTRTHTSLLFLMGRCTQLANDSHILSPSS